jgi:hypothetical protein
MAGAGARTGLDRRHNIQNIAASGHPDPAAQEHRMWHQWYLQTGRGRTGLEQNRREIARLLWHLWSPNWQFDDATFDATAASFDNPEFAAVTVQSYRHRHGKRRGRPGAGADRARAGGATADHSPDDRLAWRRRRGLAAGAIGAASETFDYEDLFVLMRLPERHENREFPGPNRELKTANRELLCSILLSRIVVLHIVILTKHVI